MNLSRSPCSARPGCSTCCSRCRCCRSRPWSSAGCSSARTAPAATQAAPGLANAAIAARDERAASIRRSPASKTVEAEVLRQALLFTDGGSAAFLDAVEQRLAAERAGLDRGTVLLGTIGNNAPFVGLFGTVLGIIEAFSYLGTGDQAAMGNVSERDLRGAGRHCRRHLRRHPAVIGFNVAQKKAGELENSVLSLARLLSAWIKLEEGPRGRPRRSGQPGAPARSAALSPSRSAAEELEDMAGTTNTGGRRRAPIAAINVTPLVDVMLVLLVIMMVSATYIVSQTLKVEPPKTATSTTARPPPSPRSPSPTRTSSTSTSSRSTRTGADRRACARSTPPTRP